MDIFIQVLLGFSFTGFTQVLIKIYSTKDCLSEIFSSSFIVICRTLLILGTALKKMMIFKWESFPGRHSL